MEKSQYQKDILSHMDNPVQSICVEACAGSAKTTVLCWCAEQITQQIMKRIGTNDPVKVQKVEPALFLAFNVHIKTELEQKLPNHFAVKTVNGLGHATLFFNSKINKHNLVLSADKINFIIEKMIKNNPRDRILPVCRGVVRSLVNMAKLNGIVPYQLQNEHRCLQPDNMNTWRQIIAKHNLDERIAKTADADPGTPIYENVEKQIIALTRAVLVESIKDVERCDYNDQIYIPVIKGMRMKKYNWVFVDELQDISPIQLELIKMATTDRTIVVGCGDVRQTLYLFRGADKHAIAKFKKMFNCRSMPLSISYRCGKEIVKESQKFNPAIEAWDQACEGKVIDRGTKFDVCEFKCDDLVISRYNAPLVHIGIRLMLEKKTFRYTGRAFIEELKKIIQDVGGSTIDAFYDRFRQWTQKKIAYIKSMQLDELLPDISDKQNCLNEIRHLFGARDPVSKLVDFLEKTFSDKNKGVSLSTVFRAKGLEADRVFFVDTDLLPADLYPMTPEERTVEYNILYVGVTRAKKELHYISTPEFFRKKFYANKNTEYAEPKEFAGCGPLKTDAFL